MNAQRVKTTTGGNGAGWVERVGQQQSGICSEPSWTQTMLLSLLIGTAGAEILISGHTPYLPHFGTSPTVVDNRPLNRLVDGEASHFPTSRYQQALAMSVANQAREVLAALALNKSQLADILRVSRPTLYDWLDGKEPHPAKAERMVALLRLLGRTHISSATPVNAKFVRQPIDERGVSLIEELGSEKWDESHVEGLLNEARKLSEMLEANRLQREDRLRGLGYETPSDEQRRELIGQTVAMLDWPKP